MTKPEMLALMRLLSSLESWAMCQAKLPPDYLLEDIASHVALLEREILKEQM